MVVSKSAKFISHLLSLINKLETCIKMLKAQQQYIELKIELTGPMVTPIVADLVHRVKALEETVEQLTKQAQFRE